MICGTTCIIIFQIRKVFNSDKFLSYMLNQAKLLCRYHCELNMPLFKWRITSQNPERGSMFMIDFNLYYSSYIPVIRNIERRNERNFKTFLLKNMLDKSDNSYIEFRGVLGGGALLRFCRPPPTSLDQ